MTTPSKLPDDLKDTLATEQWWLFNTGQKVTKNLSVLVGGTPGIDLNVLPLWPQYTGKGIKVGILDDGIEGTHEDLAGNFNKDLSLSDTLGGPYPKTKKDNHGTQVAGVIAGRRNNLGTVGVAYESTIAGYYIFGIKKSLTPGLDAEIDVSNNSWGFDTSFVKKANDVEAIKNAVTNGRQKLGTVFVFSGGNFRQHINPGLSGAEQRGNNVNLTYLNSRYVIDVAAIDNKGVVAPYSNPGAPLLVSAFGDGGSIATVDRTDDEGNNTKENVTLLDPLDPSLGLFYTNFKNLNYTNDFNGTSSAAPMVSGVAALI
ncbi:MAG: S8 family serine peptidase, partial [Microcoleus sp.]